MPFRSRPVPPQGRPSRPLEHPGRYPGRPRDEAWGDSLASVLSAGGLSGETCSAMVPELGPYRRCRRVLAALTRALDAAGRVKLAAICPLELDIGDAARFRVHWYRCTPRVVAMAGSKGGEGS
jgi:hypothetical protein